MARYQVKKEPTKVKEGEEDAYWVPYKTSPRLITLFLILSQLHLILVIAVACRHCS